LRSQSQNTPNLCFSFGNLNSFFFRLLFLVLFPSEKKGKDLKKIKEKQKKNKRGGYLLNKKTVGNAYQKKRKKRKGVPIVDIY